MRSRIHGPSPGLAALRLPLACIPSARRRSRRLTHWPSRLMTTRPSRLMTTRSSRLMTTQSTRPSRLMTTRRPSRLMTTRPLRLMTTRHSRLMTTRPSRLMTTRPPIQRGPLPRHANCGRARQGHQNRRHTRYVTAFGRDCRGCLRAYATCSSQHLTVCAITCSSQHLAVCAITSPSRNPTPRASAGGEGPPQTTPLLSVRGCKWGSRPLSSITPHIPKQAGEDASFFSLQEMFWVFLLVSAMRIFCVKTMPKRLN